MDASVERLAQSRSKAINALERAARSGELPDEVALWAAVANECNGFAFRVEAGVPVSAPGQDVAAFAATLSRRSLYRWFDLREAEGWEGLVPKRRKDGFTVPTWGPYLLKLWRVPQKPSLAQAVSRLPDLLPAGMKAPSYHAADRWIKKLGGVEKQRGRMGPRELRTIQPFTRRSTEGLWPMDVVVPDGHCFDAEVQHPFHGRPFRPEITTYVDVATRRVVGWNVWLAESVSAILAALRQMVLRHGIPAVHYSDRGAYRAEMFTDGMTGILPRLGIDPAFSLPYNSQARGVIERLHQTLWVRMAREMKTYVGHDMDKQARQIAFKGTRQQGRFLAPWADFLRACEMVVAAYNAAPHSSLPRMVDPQTGKRRNMSPDEAWAQAEADGWAPVALEGDSLDDLLPQVVRTVQRGEVSLPWGKYFSHELAEWHRQEVRVAYDLQDGDRVWVRDLEGRLICAAEQDGNVQPYMPENYMEHAREKRAKGRLSRLERHVEEAQAERHGNLLIEHQALLNPLKAPEIPAQPVSMPRAGVKVPPSLTAQELEAARQVAREAMEPAKVVQLEESPRQRFLRWLDVERRLLAGESFDSETLKKLMLYQQSREYRTHKAMQDDFEGFGEAR